MLVSGWARDEVYTGQDFLVGADAVPDALPGRSAGPPGIRVPAEQAKKRNPVDVSRLNEPRRSAGVCSFTKPVEVPASP